MAKTATNVKKFKKVAKPVPAPGTKTAKTKAAKPAVEKKVKAPKATVFVGRTTGLRVGAFQDKLMERNFKAKLTDAQLAKAMREEFPNAVKFEEKHVRGIRSAWNNGRRAGQEGAPEKLLPEYGDDGKPVERRRGPKPNAGRAAKKTVKKTTKKIKPEPEEEEEIDESEEEDVEEEDEDEEEEVE